MSIAKRNSVLARAAAGVLYRAGEDDKAKGGAEADKPKPAGDDSAILREFQAIKSELADLREQLAAAKPAKRKRREAEEDDADEDEGDADDDEGEKARVAVAAAKQEATEANRRAQIAEVGVLLRDHLTEKYKEFVGNAKDIILHIEKDLPDNPKPAEIQRLIADHSRAFVERIRNAKGAHGAPAGGTRGKLPQGSPIGVGGAVSGEDRSMKPREASPRRPFQTINWHG